MAFKAVHTASSAPRSPLALFADLPRMGDAVPNLWGHQTGVLSAYAESHANHSDVAIELPTGTGKTVPGLLIADWRRRALGEQVVYACPTVQLARQTARAANREGIPAVALVGGQRAWPLGEVTRYDAAEAIAVTTYSTVFNASPKIGRPGSIFFDDAHAGEQFVAEQWSADISRFRQPTMYRTTIDALRPALDGIFAQRLEEDDPDPRARLDVRLVVPQRRHLVAALDQALATATGDLAWRVTMIRSGLAACLVYVSWNSVLIRPFIPPTFDNEPFLDARQRVYLSATLGQGGELERAFGRAQITRLALPPEAGTPRNGRRFFVFAGLCTDENTDAPQLARSVTALAGKALVLAPTGDTAARTAADLNPGTWPVLDKSAVTDSLDAFTTTDHALLALARYDGMDLPDATCRLVVLNGKPDAAHLQERFLASQLRARIALEERIRTRIVQGAGRCTRNPTDHAIVLITGDTLTRYLSEPGVRHALTPELQAEISFGAENSRTTIDEILTNVRAFLAQGDDWRNHAEPAIAQARHTATTAAVTGTTGLAASAPHEIEACRLAWRGAWAEAAVHAEQAAHALSGNEQLRHYRAFWLYLAAVWLHAAADSGDAAGRSAAEALVARAVQASRGTGWLRDTEPADNTAVQISADDTPAVRRIADLLTAGVKRATHDKKITEIGAGLTATAATVFEPALTQLGGLLGAEAFKPDGQGRCDAAWCWNERIWLTIEAKSGQNPDKPVPLRDVRQANTQLRLLAADRGVAAPPDGSAALIVSPRGLVDQEAIAGADREVHLIEPAHLQAIAADTAAAWQELLAKAPGMSNDDLQRLIRDTFSRKQILPTQILTRLTGTPLNGVVTES